MTFWYLVSLILTAHGMPVADIPRAFATQAECQVEGNKRALEIASDNTLAHGVWACLSVDFPIADPVPAPLPTEPLEPKREG